MSRKKNAETGSDAAVDEGEGRTEPTPGKSRTGGTRGRKSTATIEKELREQFTAFLGVSAMMWAARDDVCSASLADNAEGIAGGLAHFCAKSKHARKLAAAMTDTSALVPFTLAVVNFGSTVYAHHAPNRFVDEPQMGGFPNAAAPVDLTGRTV